MTIADHIFKYLNDHDMTQREFAEIIGHRSDYVTKIIVGRHLPSARNCKKLAKVLGITVDELLEDL